MKLTKIELPQETYWNVFRAKDGSKFEVETTEQEYRSLAMPKAINPKHPDGVWCQSYSTYKLPIGTYCDEKGIQFLVNVDGDTRPVSIASIEVDELTLDGAKELEKALQREIKK